MGVAVKAYQTRGGVVVPATGYTTPDGRGVEVISNVATLFSDDFGGAALDTVSRWTVIDGGAAGIGTGVTGITDSVANSALTVNMGTTNNAERWYLSQQAFAGAEDLTVVLAKSQALAANSIWIGLVEVDPLTLAPLQNPLLASQFTNLGGVEFGATTVVTAYACQALGDSSGVVATGSTAVALASLVTASEFMIEFHAEDVICSNATIDTAGSKSGTPSRVSSQAPNDTRVYRLLMRFRNTATPGSATTVAISRVLLVLGQEMRVEVTSGRGDLSPQKAVPVNIANTPVQVSVTASQTLTTKATGGLTASRLSAASPVTGVLRTGLGQIYAYDLQNTTASQRWMQFYGKATAPTLGTDTPLMTVGVPPNARITLAFDIGWAFTNGIAYAVTTDNAAVPATAATAGDVQGVVGYN
jgi:hypothetical protein